MISPVFAHLLKETSSGLRMLSFMTMIPQMASFVLAPVVGMLEDRYGKRPFLLLGFAGLAVADIGNLFAHSATAYVGIRLFQAIVSAGIMPAQMGMLADVVSEQHRTRRISLMMAGHAGGFTLGPLIGGFLLQRWGTIAPFGLSALVNIVIFCFVCILLPKASSRQTHRQNVPREKALIRTRGERKVGELLNMSFLVPLSFFVGLLMLDFAAAFGRTFVEPQKALYLYNVLKFTPVQFGLLMSSQGLAILLGQLILSQWGGCGDKRLLIAGSFLSHAVLIFSLLFTHQFVALFLVSQLAGIGGGMGKPLLSACYLESTTPQHHASIIGLKEAIYALGEIVGSLIVILASPWLIPPRTFLIGGGIIAGTSLLALFVLKSYHTAVASSTALTSGERTTR
jgi:Arabinose efflux permease